MLVFLITSVITSRRAGTLWRFVSPGRWGREDELPPGSAPPPPPPLRGPSLSSGCLFCDISGRHATPRLASMAAWLRLAHSVATAA
uniref:Uncharacterized protein n=1 Tax=Arundo donax TaxID=35708 RepID=A0A0A9FXJ8_ARUDO